MVLFLAGDIGATNSRISLWEYDGNPSTFKSKTYASKEFKHLNDVIIEFLREFGVTKDNWPRAAVMAVAGPVANNAVLITNLKWSLNGDDMARVLNIPSVLLMNDFEAIGYSIMDLDPAQVDTLQEGKVNPTGPIAVLGAGSGLGECYLTHNGEEYIAWPTEGGHSTFPAQSELEFKICQFIKNKHKLEHVSVERLVSGLGLPDVYEFFCKEFPQQVDASVDKAIKTAIAEKKDVGKAITEQAEKNPKSLARRTIDTFVSLYGAEAGNQALKILPTGGLYIAGGIAPSIMWAMTGEDRFLKSFRAKGRMSGLVSKIQIKVIKDKDIGLRGAKVMCRRVIQKKGLTGKALSSKL